MRTRVSISGLNLTGKAYLLNDDKTVKLVGMSNRKEEGKPPHVVEILYYGPANSLSNLCKGDEIAVQGYLVGSTRDYIATDKDGKAIKDKGKFVHHKVNSLTVCIDVTERGLKSGVPNELRVTSKNPTVIPMVFWSTKRNAQMTFSPMVPLEEAKPAQQAESFNLQEA